MKDRVSQAKQRCLRYPVVMAGIRGKSGPPGNQNAFRHGLAAVHNRRSEGELTENERDIRAEILADYLVAARH